MYNVSKICIHYRRSEASADQFSSLAQSVEHLTVNQGVVGSSPTGGVCYCSNFWLLGQAVKTSPFHGGNTGSIPVGVIKIYADMA